jgi:hypothetical protein
MRRQTRHQLGFPDRHLAISRDMVNPRTMSHVEALLVRVLAVSKHTARVIRVGLAVLERLPVCPDNQTYSELVPNSLSGHVWTAPGWQGLSSRLQHWSERPCVRPFSAAHLAAGHNALRGSGPGQFLAFYDAVALVGCPDHQIDRFCITCCLPLPTVTSRRMPTRSLHIISAAGCL